jgi:UDP-3-O-[3-hydroxymyristoyl] glucosamine N-acyltransferase
MTRVPFGTSRLEGAVHPEALLEDGVRIDAGATIGAHAEIGRGTTISEGAVVAEGVAIGRDCFVGARATIEHSLIGDRVIIRPDACIGQERAGQAAASDEPRVGMPAGRVILQDAVEIGADTTIECASGRDTVVGEGTKIDNQVRIAQNVQIGRHVVIGARVGIGEAARLGDFVVIGSQTEIGGEVRIGERAEIAAGSAVHGDVAAGGRWEGIFARAATVSDGKVAAPGPPRRGRND